ncbi:hypothetical protein [Salmonella phage vB-SalM-PM10]|uniref:Uncharacterized protein n=2 Tax=Kuttervirus PM10 TaxID=2169809 RepID=A0A1B0Z167_9CAUD|nr:hypothetical protein BI092_gp207 [Salmonella phage vB-SalM-PM10]ANO57809.1 hypothetical protein [Salmonella phage vB-SalM-PM10]QIG60382.1 hypothetical protein chennai_017 [Salmonella phage Chennai]UNI71366.1 tail protein [Salmonella phage vB_SenA_SM5]URQ08929.1 hypothetical protein BRM13312_00102 [Salmonella phage BRM 13312]
MATAKIIPNASTWTQVSDGTSLKTLQVTHGSVYLTDNPTAPAANAPAHIILQGNIIVLTPPTVGWIKSASGVPVVILS